LSELTNLSPQERSLQRRISLGKRQYWKKLVCVECRWPIKGVDERKERENPLHRLRICKAWLGRRPQK
jgi:hypothetical protein